MIILFWVLFIGGPIILNLLFSPPGPGYIITLFLHYPVWYGLKLLTGFVLRKTELTEPLIFGIAILVGLVCSMKFYQMGGEGEPFKELKVFSHIILNPSEIGYSDKFALDSHEGRLRRKAAQGKFKSNIADESIVFVLKDKNSRQIESFYIERFSSNYESNLQNFNTIREGDIIYVSFELKGLLIQFDLNNIQINERGNIYEFDDEFKLSKFNIYESNTGLGYILYFYFSLLY